MTTLNDRHAGGSESVRSRADRRWALNLEEAIHGCRSVREYRDEAIDGPTIRRLTDVAVQAPSAVNQQPWTFAVVRARSLVDRMSREARAHMLATAEANPHFGRFRPRLEDPGFDIFYRAPALIVISANTEGPWIAEDYCALAAENLMLAVYAEGLGTCWIGFAQSYLGTPDGKTALGVPAAWVPVAPIIVGRPKAAPAVVPRKPPEIRWIS